MKRAVLVGTNAYPYLIVYWLHLAQKYWLDEVDQVYIAVSQPVHAKPWPWIEKYIATLPKVTLVNTNTNWPNSINQVAATIEADAVCLMHDDLLIFKRGVVDNYFKHVEKTGEVVTTMHAIYTPGQLVEELMVKKYSTQVPVVVDNSDYFSYYLNFTFVPGKYFVGSSRDFGQYVVPVGEYSPLLDWTPAYKPFESDTNFKFNLELYAQGAHVHPIPKLEFTNYIHHPRGLQQFIDDFKNSEGLFAATLTYLHLQTMAYHIAGLYYDLGEREQLETQSGGPVARNLEHEAFFAMQKPWRNDKMFKLALLREFMTANDFEGIGKYHQHAKTELDWITARFNLDKKLIKQVQGIFHQLFEAKP